MFFIDDLFLRFFGVSLKPVDMVWILELINDYALKERYDLKEIKNQLKENRLLFEIGEVKENEYKEKNELLMERLEKASEIMMNLSDDIRIQEGI